MVVMVGIDVHKQTHCAVAVDEGGRQLGRPLTVRATDAGHRQLLRWAGRAFAEGVEFAVEDCRHVSTRLERALLDAGGSVVRVPPKLMALTRTSARTRGKSDPIDALAIARAALREPQLPRAEHTHASRELKLLVDHREDLITTRTGLQNRLRWRLHELDPEFELSPRGPHTPERHRAVPRRRQLSYKPISDQPSLLPLTLGRGRLGLSAGFRRASISASTWRTKRS